MMNQREGGGTSGGIVLLGLLAVIGFGTTARGGAFTQVVSFGDSLTDAGNVSLATGGAVPGPAYHDGRFSNGPVWVEYLAKKLGVATPTPSSLGGTDYAWGYAESSAGYSPVPIPNVGVQVPNLLTQVDQYLATSPSLGSGQLLTIWAGANDFLYGDMSDPTAVVAKIVANIGAAVTTLAGAGGSQFLLANLPLLGDIPATSGLPPADQAALNGLTNSLNALLFQKSLELEQTLGITVHYLDVAGGFQAIIADPSAFGLTNVTDPMMGTGQTGGYLFWDPFHPTTQVHQLVADLAYNAVVPEPSSVVLLGIAGVALTVGTGIRHRLAKRAA